jgi:hypothetical protein
MNSEEEVEKEGWLKRFAEKCLGKDPEERASLLEGDSEVCTDACVQFMRLRSQSTPLIPASIFRSLTRAMRMPLSKDKHGLLRSTRSSSCTLSP